MSTKRLTKGAAAPDIPIQDGALLATIDGLPLLGPGPAFAVVADGAFFGRLTAPAVSEKDGVTLVAGTTGDLAITQSIRPRADGCVLEFKIEVVNTGSRPIHISEARSFAATLAPGDWKGLGFSCGWGEEFEPVLFDLEEPTTSRPDRGARRTTSIRGSARIPPMVDRWR